MARIKNHFPLHQDFFADNQLLKNAGCFAAIPGVIVRRHYDMAYLVDQGWALGHALRPARMEIVPNAGHSLAEPVIIEAWVGDTNDHDMRLT